MKIRHQDVCRVSAPDMALMIDAGWVRHWPFEIRPAAVRYIRAHGWEKSMRRAVELVVRTGKGQFSVRARA